MTSSRATINELHYIPGETQTKQGNVYTNGTSSAHYKEKTESAGIFTYLPKKIDIFHKSITVQAYDARYYRKHKKLDQVWEGSAESSGENSDLREVMDYLLVQAFAQFGKNISKTMHTTMNGNDKDVEKLRNS